MSHDAECPLTPEVRLLVQQAAAFRLVALLFSVPSPHTRQEVQALLPEVADSLLAEAGRCWLDTIDPGRYFACFAPIGQVSLRLVSYLPRISPGDILAELQRCYAAFGYVPFAAEPPDHLAVQVDFLAFLFLKRAYALAGSDVTSITPLEKTCKRFWSEFLHPILGNLPQTLSQAETACLAQAAEWLKRSSLIAVPISQKSS